MRHTPLQHWVLWDGNCGLCRRWAAWARRRDIFAEFTVVPFQQAPTPPLTAELQQACQNALHIVKADGQVLQGGRAVLFIWGRLSHPRVAAILALPPFIWAIELGYRFVASARRLFGASKVITSP